MLHLVSSSVSNNWNAFWVMNIWFGNNHLTFKMQQKLWLKLEKIPIFQVNNIIWFCFIWKKYLDRKKLNGLSLTCWNECNWKVGVMAKRKWTNDKQWFVKRNTKSLKLSNTYPTKTGRWTRRINSSWFTSDIRLVTLVTVIRHECGKDWIVIKANGSYPHILRLFYFLFRQCGIFFLFFFVI